MIEHNTEIILASDWVIDLGPEGGKHGGEIIAQGRPKEIAQIKNSATGELLSKRGLNDKEPKPVKKVPRCPSWLVVYWY